MKKVGMAVALVLAMSLGACSPSKPVSFDGTAVEPPSQAANFTLTDGAGAPWSLQGQRGKIVALFFGYTNCTDVCPMTLAKLVRAVDGLGTAKRDAEIAFVTVDPQRDTPRVLAAYVKRFGSANIVGLTGTAAQLAPVMHAYHVWAQKIPGKDGAPYQMAHSSAVYFIDANGDLRVVHDWDDPETAFAHDLKELSG